MFTPSLTAPMASSSPFMNSAATLLLIITLIVSFTPISSCHSTPCAPPTPKIPTPSAPTTKCSVDTLKFAACADMLNGVAGAFLGGESHKCCSLVTGLADMDAALCLCMAVKAGVLGDQLNVPVEMSVLFNACGKKSVAGFKCC